MDEDNRKALMEEVVRGHEFAQQLQQVFVNNHPPNELLAQHLLNKLLNSFTNTLFLLDIKTLQPTHTNESLMNHLSFVTSSAISSNQESCSNSSSPEDQSNKRRKTTQKSTSWENVSEALTDDGQQWRKYGQKVINNSKYTRNYYRCSHKLEQKCEATKQEQRIQEKPPLYKTTYYGQHICNNPNIILDDPSPTSPHDTSILLSFDKPTKQQYRRFLSSEDQLPSSSYQTHHDTSILVSFDNPTKQQYCPFLSSEDQLPSSSYQTHLTNQSSSTLGSDDKDTDMIYDLLCDSFEVDNLFQTSFVGVS